MGNSMLFQRKAFVSHAGLPLTWKVECDALTDEDWCALAWVISQHMSFMTVEGVPTGGLKLAAALQRYCQADASNMLIVDDVYTTGASMEAQRAGRDAIGCVVFARTQPTQPWIRAVWQHGLL